MAQQHAFILKAKAHPERADDFERLFRAYVEPSRREPGCIEYHMLRDLEDPSLFIFFEVWASEHDFNAHMALPHMRTFVEQRAEYLEGEFDVQRIEMLSPSSASR
ncbi:putative quinol monooxygenase [Pseudomonas phoenicis]|uniref:putative quinol monooxygenase n=1 Tax=unclassified Pseudomonas TaxID=196821 RepID=UPI0039A24D67